MRRFTLASLLGSDTRPLAWERPFLLAAALIVSDLLVFGLGYSVSHSSDGGFSLRFFDIGSPWQAALGTTVGLLQVALLLLALRVLRRERWAILVAAVVYGLAVQPVVYLTFGLGIGSWRPAIWGVQYVLGSIAVLIVFFGCLAVALRLIPLPGLALVIGVACGNALGPLATTSVRALVKPPDDWAMTLGFAWRGIPIDLLVGAVAGALVWAGLATAGSFREEAPRPLVRRPFFVGTYVAANGAALVTLAVMLLLVALEIWGQRRAPAGIGGATQAHEILGIALVSLLGFLFGAGGTVVFLRLVYRMWSAIQDGHARTTPGRAVGLLFVPFFNLYWIFQALPGFASDFNALLRRRQLHVAPLSGALWIIFVVLNLAGIVPVVGIPATLASYVVGIVLIRQTCDAINAVAEAAEAGNAAAV
jgi:hypothetical protein